MTNTLVSFGSVGRDDESSDVWYCNRSCRRLGHAGRIRRINEDVFLSDPDLGLFIVADGMGGHHAGEVASQLAVETIRSFLTRTRDGEDVTWPYGIDPNLSFDGNRMLTAVRLANRRVFKAGESREDYTGMGTTTVAALITGNRCVFSNVGDSRIYVLNDEGFVQLTQDDTWVAMMMGKGEPGVNPNHPMKHVLTNVIGARDQIDCRVTERELTKEETYLFCSDGLHGFVAEDALEAALRLTISPAEVAERLVQQALDAGGADNITALVVRYRP
jgi:protein phosphatase